MYADCNVFRLLLCLEKIFALMGGAESATFYKWRSKFGGMDALSMSRLKELEDENRRLKKMYAEERLKAESPKRLYIYVM